MGTSLGAYEFFKNDSLYNTPISQFISPCNEFTSV